MKREISRPKTSLQGFPRGEKGTTVADDPKEMLDRLELDLAALKHEYDLFFHGKRRAEPMKERKALETKLVVGSRRTMTGNADQLRFNNLSGRYWAYANLWTRTMRDLEEGRIHRDSGGSVKRGARERREPVDRENVDRAVEALMEARRSCGLSCEPSDIPSLRETLYARAVEISASAGGKKVEFLVSIDGGKPKVKAVLR
ncbi:MAG TPA: MXAN_5187 C-terminal domain-containing protein [Candidatus Deferrimicrobium sp.]|nr:MXAN_5187 C-terminal domain-containing protein [Candidatus Deferrimicrobium sp.]